MLDEQGRQRNPHLLDYKLMTCSDAPAIDVDWIEYDSVGPRGSKGVGEPPQVPTAGRDRERDLEGDRPARPRPPDDARAGVGGSAGDLRHDPLVHLSRPRSTRRCRPWQVAPVPSRAGPTWSSGPGRGRRRSPRRSSRSTGSMGCGAIEASGRRSAARHARDARRHRGERGDPLAIHGARGRLGDRRLARHPRAGHDRRQRDERLAGDGHRRPAAVLRRDGRPFGRRRGSGRSSSTSCGPDPARRRPRPTSCWWRSTSRRRLPARAPATSGSSTDGRWRSRWSGRPAS